MVQVKSGNVSSRDIRDLVGTIGREKAEMGLFITLAPSSQPMRKEAAEAGWYHSDGWGRNYPKIQIYTIDELLAGMQPDMPPTRQTFQRAERIRRTAERQESFMEFGIG